MAPPELDRILSEQTERSRRLAAAIDAASGSGDAGINELLGLSTTNSIQVEQAIVAYKTNPTDANARALTALLKTTQAGALVLLERITGGPPPGGQAITAVTVAGTGGTGTISYNGTFSPADFVPLPEIIVEVRDGTTTLASEPADTVAAGVFNGSFSGLTAGSRTLRAIAPGGVTGVSDALTVAADTTAPQIVTRTTPGATTLTAGQTINIELIWSEPVIVTGSPFLPAVLDSGNVNIAYAGGSGSTTTLWQYTITGPDTEATGVQLSGGITLNGGTIRDAAANNADLTTNNGAATLTGVLVNGGGSSFSSPGGVTTWGLALDARNPAAFGGSLPSDAANVITTSALYGATYALAQDGAAPVPTFKLDALGAGLHGIRWGTGADAHLLAAGMGEGLWAGPSPTNGDMAGVLWVVLRAQSALAATMFIAGFCHPAGTSNAAHNNFAIIGGAASIIGRYTGANTTGDATIASTIPTGENVLLRLRRLNSTDTNPLTLLRDSTTDASAQGGNANAPTPTAAANVRFTVGRRLYNNTTSLPMAGIDIGALYYLPGEPSAGVIADVDAALKSAWGVT